MTIIGPPIGSSSSLLHRLNIEWRVQARFLPTFMFLERWFYVAFKLVGRIFVFVLLRFIYSRQHKYRKHGKNVRICSDNYLCMPSEMRFPHQTHFQFSSVPFLFFFNAFLVTQSTSNDASFDNNLFTRHSWAHFIFKLFSLDIRVFDGSDLIIVRISRKKKLNVKIKHNWKLFDANFFFFPNINSNVNFAVYLISWLQYVVAKTGNSLKNTATKCDNFFFFQQIRNFLFVITWQFEQKFRKLMFVSLGAALTKFQCTWYCWHSACAKIEFFFFHFTNWGEKCFFLSKIFLNWIFEFHSKLWRSVRIKIGANLKKKICFSVLKIKCS